MNLNKLYLTKNECYLADKTMTPKGIMVHSTGANNPNLKRYVGPDDGKLGKNELGNYWNTARPGGRQVCTHAFIGKLANGSIATYQVLPWTMVGWHAGGTANQTHIGFEICEDGLTDATYFNAVYKEAVDLCVYLCRLYGLTEKNIICHSEGYKLRIASNHSDVMHWFPRFGKSMDTFRAEVKKGLSAAAAPVSKPSAALTVGDKVVLNGAVYSDSYGGGKGRSFQNKTCIIIRTVDFNRKCPYLLDNGLGWVPKDSIRKL